MGSQLNLRALKAGDTFLCGTELMLTDPTKSALANLCVDYGKHFANEKDKKRHLQSKHRTSLDKNAQPCPICLYDKKNHKSHVLRVGAVLQVPTDYPAMEE